MLRDLRSRRWTIAERIPQSVAYLVVFRAFLASDGKTPATGKTVAITISKNGATSFSNPAAGATNATEMASGFYKFTLGSGDTDTLGPLAWRGAEGTINDAGDVLTVEADYGTIADIVDAFYDEQTSGHTILGSGGKALADAATAPGLVVTLATKVLKYFQLGLRKDAAIATDNATEVGEINADEGSGAGAFANSTDSQEAIADDGPGVALPSFTVQTDGGNSATQVKTNRTETADDYWKDALVLITSGTMAGQVKKVTAYNGTTKIISFGAFTGTPADGVVMYLINR